MQKISIGVIGYSSNYNKFIKNIKNSVSNYNLKFILKKTELKKPNFDIKITNLIKNNKIKFLIVCDKSINKKYLSNIEFLIKKKIVIVQASTNFEIDNHGFITKKLFKDFSFEDIFLRKTLKLNQTETLKYVKNKVIIVTGGAGSIGTYLVKNLLKYNPKKIIIIDNNEYNIFRSKNIIKEAHQKQLNYKIANIDDKNEIDNIIKYFKPNIVFNTAALKHVNFLEENPNQGLKINYRGTKNVIGACNKYNVKIFIHVSTDKAANPINTLGISKFLSEISCHNEFKKNKTKIGIVRFGNVFDSYGSVSETFKNNILNSKKIKISNPNAERYFMSKDEAANFLIYIFKILYFENEIHHVRTFIYNMGEPIKIIDLAKKIIFLSGRPYEKFLSKKYYGLKNIEKVSESLLNNHEIILRHYNKLIIEISSRKKFIKIINFKKIDKIIDKNNNSESTALIKRLKKIFN